MTFTHDDDISNFFALVLILSGPQADGHASQASQGSGVFDDNDENEEVLVFISLYHCFRHKNNLLFMPCTDAAGN